MPRATWSRSPASTPEQGIRTAKTPDRQWRTGRARVGAHLAARKKIRLDHAIEQITARHPTGEEAELLRITQDAPVLSVNVTAYDAAGQPVQVSDLVLPGQRHEIRDAYALG